ncbi:MAG: flavodoxin [Eubacteriales bacterium]|nr:flavodoxin [Eubacteriales bacterium]
MSKQLVAYFSASGRTAKVAQKLAQGLQADLYEIRPQVTYTKADLNWMDSKSRSSVEMNDKSFRPAIVTGDVDVAPYDTVYLGFPIWWYVAPTLINTFLEAYEFSGKKVVLFATSGGSDFGNTRKELQISAPNASFMESKVLSGVITDKKIQTLVESCQ